MEALFKYLGVIPQLTHILKKEKKCIQEWKNTMVEELNAFLFVSIVLVPLVFYWELLFF